MISVNTAANGALDLGFRDIMVSVTTYLFQDSYLDSESLLSKFFIMFCLAS